MKNLFSKIKSVFFLCLVLVFASCSDMFGGFMNDDQTYKTGVDTVTVNSSAESNPVTPNYESTNTELSKGIVVIKKTRSAYNQIVFDPDFEWNEEKGLKNIYQVGVVDEDTDGDGVKDIDNDETVTPPHGSCVPLSIIDNPVLIKCYPSDSHARVEWSAVRTRRGNLDSTVTPIASPTEVSVSRALDNDRECSISVPYGTTLVTVKIVADDNYYSRTYKIELNKPVRFDEEYIVKGDDLFTTYDIDSAEVPEGIEIVSMNYVSDYNSENIDPSVRQITVAEGVSSLRIMYRDVETGYTITRRITLMRPDDRDTSIKSFAHVPYSSDAETDAKSIKVGSIESLRSINTNLNESDDLYYLNRGGGYQGSENTTSFAQKSVYKICANAQYGQDSVSFKTELTNPKASLSYCVGDTDLASENWTNASVDADGKYTVTVNGFEKNGENPVTPVYLRVKTKEYKHSDGIHADYRYHKIEIIRAGIDNPNLAFFRVEKGLVPGVTESGSAYIINGLDKRSDFESYISAGSIRDKNISTYVDQLKVMIYTMNCEQEVYYTCEGPATEQFEDPDGDGEYDHAPEGYCMQKKLMPLEGSSGNNRRRIVTVGALDSSAVADTDNDICDGVTTMTFYLKKSDGTFVTYKTVKFTKPTLDAISCRLTVRDYSSTDGSGRDYNSSSVIPGYSNIEIKKNPSSTHTLTSYTDAADYNIYYTGSANCEDIFFDIVPNYAGVYVRHTILNKDDAPMIIDGDNTQFTVTTRDDGTEIWQSFMRLWSSYKKSSYICIYKDEASYNADPNDFVAIIKLSFYRKPDVSLSTLKFGLASSVKQSNGSAFNSSKPRFENGAEVLTLPYVSTTEEITDNGALKVKFPVATSMFEVREKTFGSDEEDAAKNWKGTQESNAGDQGTVIYGSRDTSTTEISIPVKYEEGIIKAYSIYVYCDYYVNSPVSGQPMVPAQESKEYLVYVKPKLSNNSKFSLNLKQEDGDGLIVSSVTVNSGTNVVKDASSTVECTDYTKSGDLKITVDLHKAATMTVTVDGTVLDSSFVDDTDPAKRIITIPYDLYNSDSRKDTVVPYVIKVDSEDGLNHSTYKDKLYIQDKVKSHGFTTQLISGTSYDVTSESTDWKIGYNTDSIFNFIANKASVSYAASYKIAIQANGDTYWVTMGAGGTSTSVVSASSGSALNGVRVQIDPEVYYVKKNDSDVVESWILVKFKVTNSSGKALKIGASSSGLGSNIELLPDFADSDSFTNFYSGNASVVDSNMWIGNQTPGNGSGAHSFSFNIGTSSSATRTVAFKFVP